MWLYRSGANCDKASVLAYSTLFKDKLKEKNGLCEICNKKNDSRRGLALDHNHETGQIRGFLCGRCNKALGGLYEDIDILMAMIAYIKKYK
jgi:hypothetical protein